MKGNLFSKEHSCFLLSRWRNLLMAFLIPLLTCNLVVNAQSVTIGGSTTQGQALPVDSYFGYSYSQQIYSASAIGGYSGNITGLTFYLPSAANIANSNDWTVWVGHTTKSNFTSNTDWIAVSGLTQVFSGTVTNTAGQVTITFSAPFAYNGTDNLVIAVDENKSSYNGEADRFYVSAAPTGSSLFYRSDSTNPNPSSPPSGTTAAYLSNVSINGIGPLCSPPPSGLNATVTTNSASLGWTSDGSLFDIEWGTSGFTQGTGTMINDTSSNPYNLTDLASSTTYQYYVRKDCGVDGTSSWAGPYSFTTATPGQIGSGASTSSYFPIYSNYGYNYSQQIYLSSELNAVLAPGSTYITKIRFKQASVGTQANYNNWTVYIGNTSKSVFSGSTDWVPVAQLTQVYSGVLTFAANSWVEIVLSAPFEWNGTDNLVVAVDENTSGYSSSSFASFASGSNRGILYYNDTTNPNPSSPPTANYGPNANIAQIQIVASAPPSCFAPAALDHTQIDLTTAELNWQSDGDLFEVKWDEAGFDVDTEGFAISGITETSVEAPGLITDTEYEFYVRRDCDEDGLSEWAGPYSFSVGYCDSVPTSHDGSGITNVTMGDVSFPVGSVNYYEYVDNVANIAAGGDVISSVAFATGYTYDTNIWIDFNNDGVFDNATELVFDGVSTSASPTTLNTTFPLAANVMQGIHKMRIGTADSGQATPDPCYSGSYGVTIDLTVNITEPPSCVAPSGVTLENVAAYEADVNWDVIDNAEGYTWFVFDDGADRDTDTPVATGYVAEASVSIGGLTPETDYDFYVKTDCGTGDGESMFSTLLNFTTEIACPAPTDLEATQLSISSADLSWESDGTLFELKWSNADFDLETEGTLIDDLTETSYTLEGLDTDTEYEFYVRSNCDVDGFSSWVGPYSFSVGYCSVNPPASNDDTGITYVEFNTITNSSDTGTNSTSNHVYYSNFTGISTDVQAGQSYDLTVNVDTAGNYMVWTTAWIDWNRDGIFDVNAESYNLGSAEDVEDEATSESPLSIQIPLEASGEIRMRIKAVYGDDAVPDPCSTQTYSETEDYTINVTGPVTWTGTNWVNGTPSPTVSVLINGNLNVGTDAPGLEVNDLTVSETGSVSIPAGSTLTVNGAITNNANAASFVVESDGNLIQSGTGTNVGNIKVERYSQSMLRLDYAMWSSPVINQNLFDFSPNTVNGVTNYIGSAGRIYIYDGTNGYVNPTPFDANAVFGQGVGYLFRSPNNWSSTTPAPYQGVFTGVPFNGDRNVNTYAGSFTSIGNPYPSNIDANLLMGANPGISTLYFWVNSTLVDGAYTGNNYATYTDLGGTAAYLGGITPTNVISVGQGFIVETSDTSVSFDNTMRTDNGSGFINKTDEAEKHRFWLNLSDENNNGLNQILIGYMTGATQGIDHQIDGKMFGYEGSAIYNLISEEKFTIQGRALPFENSDIVPLGFKAVESGKYHISLDNVDGLFAEGQVIYLKDKALDNIHDLTVSAYEFESVAGEFKDRFEIVYQGEDGTMGIDDLTANGIMIYKNAGNIEISSKNSNIISVDVFDLQGRRLFSKSGINNNIFQVKFDRFATQVLVVKVRTENGVLTNKKIVNN